MAERSVTWKAIADFASIAREARNARRELQNLQKSEEEFNAAQERAGGSSAATNTRSANAMRDAARAAREKAAAARETVRAEEDAAKSATAAASARGRERAEITRTVAEIRASVNARRAERAATEASTAALNQEAVATARARDERGRFVRAVRDSASAQDDAARASERMRTSQERNTRETGMLGRAMSGLGTQLRKMFPAWDANAKGAAKMGGSMRVVGTALKLMIIPVVIAGLNGLLGLLSPLTAGFLGLAGAIGPVSGLLATMPGLLAAATGGILTLVAGFSGIGGALKAYGQQQKAAAKASASAADTQRTSARAIRNAEQSLKDAHKQAEEAQEAVTQARKDARRAIADLRNELRDLEMAERGASMGLEEARENLQRVLNDPGSTDLQRRQAQLAVDQAKASLGDVQRQQADAAASMKDARKKGVEGSDQVVAAIEAEERANRAVVSAEEALADARRQGATAAAGGAAANDLYAESLEKLTPEARAVVAQLIRMKPLIDGIRATAQRGLMPGVLSFLQDVSKLFPLFNTFVGRASRDFGDFFTELGEGMSSASGMSAWSKVLDSTNRVIASFLRAGGNTAVVMGNIALAARDLTEWLAGLIEGWTESWRTMTSGEAGQRRLTEFFVKTREAAELLGRITGNLTGTLVGLGRGTASLGEWMLESFDEITRGWHEWVDSVEGQNALQEWAEGSKASLSALSRLIGDLAKGLADLAGQTDTAGLIEQIRTDLLPALLRVMGLFTGETLSHIVSAISNLATVIADLGESGGGSVNAFFEALDKITGAIAWITTNVPGATSVLSALVAVLAARSAINFLGKITGAKGAIKDITAVSKKARAAIDKRRAARGPRRAAAGEALDDSTAAPRRGPGGPGSGRAAAGAAGAIDETAEAAKKASPWLLRFGQMFATAILPWILRVGLLLLRLIPGIGIVVTILSILVPLIIKHWDTIKGAIVAAMEWLKPYLMAAWNAILAYVVAPVMAIWRVIVFVFRMIWLVISTSLKIIWTFIRIAFEIILAIIMVVLGAVWRYIKWVWGAVFAIFRAVIGVIIAIVKRVWAQLLNLLILPIARAFVIIGRWLARIWRAFVGWIQPLLDFIKRGWNKLVDILSGPLNTAKEKIAKYLGIIKNGFTSWIGTVKKALAPLGKVFTDAFAKIKEAVSDPVAFAVGVINKGVIQPYRNLASKLGFTTNIEDITYEVPKFQQGGMVPGRPSAKRDNVLGVNSKGRPIARVEEGEYIMPRNKRRFFPLLEAIRSGRIRDLPAFARGGKVWPVPGRQTGTYPNHTGVDINRGSGWDDFGDLIRAVTAGVITHAGFGKGYGQAVFQRASSGHLLIYGHASAVRVRKGQRVSAGDPIANVGNTGNSSAPHLHFEVRPGATYAAAMNYLRGSSTALGSMGRLRIDNPGAAGVNEQTLQNTVQPKSFLGKLFDKAAAGIDKFTGSEFGKMITSIPSKVLGFAVDKAKSIMGLGDVPEHASGTNATRRGYALVGEQGPELVRFRGGEQVHSTRRSAEILKGYHSGGVVGGMKVGARGDWVRAIRSQAFAGTSDRWTAGLDRLLRRRTPQSLADFDSPNSLVSAIVTRILRSRKGLGLDDLARALGADVTAIWRARGEVERQMRARGVSRPKRGVFNRSATTFGGQRAKWVKSLEKKLGMPATGVWGSELDEPFAHAVMHGQGRSHDAYLDHPWQSYTTIENAIRDARRANRINAEFDALIQKFSGWTLMNLVRKLEELGPADGLTLARAMGKSKGQAVLYDKDLGVSYAREDAKSGDSPAAKIRLLIKTVGAGTTEAPIGLQGAAAALSLSLDSTAALYDQATAQGLWGDVKPSQRARIAKEVEDFRKLFRFARGGIVPGWGNGDRKHALLEPGELVLRSAATRELIRQFGSGAPAYLNNLDRFANGGYVPGGVPMPSVNALPASVRSTTGRAAGTGPTTVNNFNTNVYNPTLEDGALSVQKRVTRIARMGLLNANDRDRSRANG